MDNKKQGACKMVTQEQIAVKSEKIFIGSKEKKQEFINKINNAKKTIFI